LASGEGRFDRFDRPGNDIDVYSDFVVYWLGYKNLQNEKGDFKMPDQAVY